MTYTYNRQEIKNFIPHRGLFLFLHEARIADEKAGSGVAIWPSSHTVFEGHFPEISLVPGVYLVEAAAQLSGVIISSAVFRTGQSLDDSIGVLAGVRNFTVSAPVFPDDRVTIDIKLNRTFPKMGMAYAQGKIRDKRVFEAQLMLGVASKTEFNEVSRGRLK